MSAHTSISTFKCLALRALRSASRRWAGFTLIELLIVILIIAILAAVALPSFLTQPAKAQDSSAETAITTAFTEAKVAAIENQDAYPDSPTLASTISTNEPQLGTVLSAPDTTALIPGQVYVIGTSAGGNTEVAELSHSGSVCTITSATWMQSGPTCEFVPQDKYSQTILADRPWGFWRLTDQSGTTSLADSSGFWRTASFTGPLSFQQESLLTSENSPSVFLQSGASMSLGSSERFTSAYTLEGWVQAAFSGSQPVYAVYEYANGEAELLVDDSATTAGAHGWQSAPAWPNSNPGIDIPGSVFSLSPGYYSNIAFYNYDLSPTQIAAHYQAGIGS